MIPTNFDQIKVPLPCRMDWDKMGEVSERTHLCNMCKREVYDLTKASIDEFQQIYLANNGDFCGRYDNRINVQSSLLMRDENLRLSRFLGLLLLFFGQSFFNITYADSSRNFEAVRASIANSWQVNQKTPVEIEIINRKSDEIVSCREIEVWINDSLIATQSVDKGGFKVNLPDKDGVYKLSFFLAGYVIKDKYIKVRIKNGRPTRSKLKLLVERNMAIPRLMGRFL
jgi:hypothetical protein